MSRRALSHIFLILFAILAISTLIKPFTQDEGVFLTIAKGLSQGLLPYRDFFDHKTPGIYFALSIPINLFGDSIIAPKALLLLVNLATTIFTFLIAQKLKINGIIGAIFFVFGLIFFEGNFVIAEPFVVLFLTISVYLLLIDKLKQKYLLVGVCLAAAFFFKQSAIINLASILLFYTISRKWKPIILISSGFMLLLFILIIYLWKNGLMQQSYEQIILYNISNYPSEPFFQLIEKLWPVFVKTLPIWLFAFWGTIHAIRQKQYLIVIFAIIPVALFFNRHYPHYWIQVLPFMAILAALALQQIKSVYQYTIIISTVVIALFLQVSVLKGNFFELKESIAINQFINLHDQNYLLAENQFTAYYFTSDKKPLNKYLYITEVNDITENSEAKTLADLKLQKDALVTWPSDPNFAFAKNLQRYIYENYEPIKNFDVSGTKIYQIKN